VPISNYTEPIIENYTVPISNYTEPIIENYTVPISNYTEPIIENYTVPISNYTEPIIENYTAPISNYTEPIIENYTAPISNYTEPIIENYTAPIIITDAILEESQQVDGMYKKLVIVDNGTERTRANIPEDLVESGAEISLNCEIDGEKQNITNDPAVNLKFVDTDGNGLADQMEWTVPEGVTEFTIESEITIINLQSYPTVGSFWTVYFTTIGTEDLIITAIDGTTFGASLPADLGFVNVICGETELQYQRASSSIIVEDYFCEV